MSLETQVGQLLKTHSLTIAVAESCTGGLLGHRLTNVAGSSAYMLGGVIAYSNVIKQRLLNVTEATLIAHGAVSEAVAAAMAQGVRKLIGTDIGVSITGIAGPGGGTADKPVGLTYVGLSTEDRSLVSRFVWEGDRIANKQYSAEAALRLLLDQLKSEG